MTRLASQPATLTRTGQRGDIEGLRALAIVLVLLAHAGLPFLPGGFVGVDVFFVISGFLVTRLLVDERERTGRISPLGFYARRAKRLLPAAGLVLVVTLPLALLLLPKSRWGEVGWDTVASGLYAMNWRLAEGAADHLASGAAPSVLAHFWSLAVQEQFYLLWPLLLILVARPVRRHTGVWPASLPNRATVAAVPASASGALGGAADRRGVRRRRLLIAVALVAVLSFAWSSGLAQTDPSRGYVDTTARIWELALGGGLALLGHRLSRLPRPVAVLFGWVGVAAIVGAALVITPKTSYPGWPALLPVLGTAAVLVAGTAGRAGPELLLGPRPVRALGALSYPLYLWHWPLLTMTEARFGTLTPVGHLIIVLGCVALAALTQRYVVEPIRTAPGLAWHPPQALRLGALFTALPVAAGLLFQLTVWPPARPLPTGGPVAPIATAAPTPKGPGAPGAAVLGDRPRASKAGIPVDRVDRITPDPGAAREDLPDVYEDDCFAAAAEPTVATCVYGDRESTYTVALAGDSHAGNWVPALQLIAAQRRWRLVTYLNESCPFLDLEIAAVSRPLPGCKTWTAQVRQALRGPQRPNLLLTSNASYQPVRGGKPLRGDAAQRAMVDGLRRTWSAMTTAGVPTLVLRDTPHLNVRVAECAATNRRKLTRCSAPRTLALTASAGPAQEAAVKGQARVHLLNLNDAICPASRCAAVIGGVLVYRDDNHLTASYARSLSPRLRARLDALTPPPPTEAPAARND